MGYRQEKLGAALQKLTAEFLGQSRTPNTFVTVTGLKLSSDGQRGTVFLRTWPETAGAAAIKDARRRKGELRTYIYEHLQTRFVPNLEFALDDQDQPAT